jgi:predicted  nucleic acid-binding Zn-ribbon protein
MSIPPQVFVNVKKNENIINCPNCGRILYFKDAILQKDI